MVSMSIEPALQIQPVSITSVPVTTSPVGWVVPAQSEFAFVALGESSCVQAGQRSLIPGRGRAVHEACPPRPTLRAADGEDGGSHRRTVGCRPAGWNSADREHVDADAPGFALAVRAAALGV